MTEFSAPDTEDVEGHARSVDPESADDTAGHARAVDIEGDDVVEGHAFSGAIRPPAREGGEY